MNDPSHYAANDPHHINMDDVLEPGMQAADGSHYDLEVEWNAAQDSLKVTSGGSDSICGLLGTTIASQRPF